MSSTTAIYNTPSDCLAPGDVRALKRDAGLANLSDGVTLLSYDWTVPGTPVPNSAGSALANFIPPIQDATVVATPGLGLQLNPAPQPFVQTVDQAGNLNVPPVSFGPFGGFFDRIKYKVLAPASVFPPPPTVGYPAPDDGRELIATYVAAAQQTYASVPLFPGGYVPNVLDLSRDCRLSCPMLYMFDPATFFYCTTILTDDTIYADCGRAPLLKPSWGGPGPDYQGFEAQVPIARRDVAAPLSDFATVQMAYNRRAGTVRWVVNGVQKYEISELGYPLPAAYMVTNYGGPPQLVAPSVLKFGFCLYSPLDGTRPLNPTVDPGAPVTSNQYLDAQVPVALHFNPIAVVGGNGPAAGQPLASVSGDFVDPASALGSRIFGQGAQMVIKQMSVVVL